MTFSLVYYLGVRMPESGKAIGAKVCGPLTGEEGQLPVQYKAVRDMFCEKEADRLPPHRPDDCKIDLLPGTQLPTSRLYSLSEAELTALREFLDKNLERGFICPLKAPGGAPVLFVKKKDSAELRLCND